MLEYAVTTYYELFFEQIEMSMKEVEHKSPLEKLKKLTEIIVLYRQERYQLAIFIQRELSLDSMFVREVSVTYLAKEQHIIKTLFFDIVNQEHEQYKYRSFYLTQFQGMLIAPYMIQSDWHNQLSDEYSHQYFANNYIKTINHWLDFIYHSTISTPKNDSIT